MVDVVFVRYVFDFVLSVSIYVGYLGGLRVIGSDYDVVDRFLFSMIGTGFILVYGKICLGGIN